MKQISRVLLVIALILLTACSPKSFPPEVPTEEPAATVEESIPTEAPVATEPPVTEVPATEAPTRPLSGLSADPQRVEFQAEDGVKLVGYYYPSKYANAPAVILMHWAGGDLCDWSAISPWLQNRPDENPQEIERCINSSGAALKNILPPMNKDASFAVFAFDFRDYGESDKGAGWDLAKDALASFETVAGLEGVDKSRITAMGASIGADGAPDGCLLFNQKVGSGCLGALSLSPGNYLGMLYSTVVTGLDPNPVWCLAGELDKEAATTCADASGDHYRSQVYPTGGHGMMLLTDQLDPPALILIQEFLELVFGEPVKG
ncbi:MAG: hypothetical protein HZB50_02250 [Chloroflexi bacterium]|nr:hypothetical protein [Chloroflexota bacterium]